MRRPPSLQSRCLSDARCRCASVVRRRTEDPACCRHLQQHCPLLGWRLLTLTPPELPLFIDQVRRILGLGSRLLGATLPLRFPRLVAHLLARQGIKGSVCHRLQVLLHPRRLLLELRGPLR